MSYVTEAFKLDELSAFELHVLRRFGGLEVDVAFDNLKRLVDRVWSAEVVISKFHADWEREIWEEIESLALDNEQDPLVFLNDVAKTKKGHGLQSVFEVKIWATWTALEWVAFKLSETLEAYLNRNGNQDEYYAEAC